MSVLIQTGTRVRRRAATTRCRRGFFALPPQTLAPRLIGCVLVRVLSDGTRLSGRIVETEAYLGVKDRVAHSFGGRRTPRNEPMYGPPGTAYVYFTYGMHWCANVVCGRVDEPVAVLLRALEPLEGIEEMRRLRTGGPGRKAPLPDRDLCRGPARLCQALAIDRTQNGLDLATSEELFLEAGPALPMKVLARGPRIGIGSAGVWARRHLRWWLAGNRHVSATV